MFWNPKTIFKIGGQLGKVIDVNYKKYDFSSVEIIVAESLIKVDHRSFRATWITDGTLQFKFIIREIGLMLLDEVTLTSLE